MKGFLLLLVFSLNLTFLQAQDTSFLKPSDTLNLHRRNAVMISELTLGTLSLVALDQMWYADYPRGSFKTVDDSGDWLGMDKYGHVFSSYQLGRYGYDLLEWSGVDEEKSLIYGASLGFVYLGLVEVMDGFSEEWGFSWSDIAANALGTGIFVGQQLLWQEQRISLKFSFQSSEFSSLNPAQLGQGLAENLLKDYNGQTYWLSVNVPSFLNGSSVPKWFNIAFGYGAEGMLNADFSGADLPIQNPYRQFYLSLDVDLTRIKTKSHLLRTLFSVFNFIKIPSPTIELTSNGDLKLHALYF